MIPGDRYTNRRLGYPVMVLGTAWRRGSRVVVLVTTSNHAIWRIGIDDFKARFREA
jgi:hypothetical protein